MSLLEKRFRKELRTRKVLDPSKVIWLVDDGTPFVEIAERLLRKVFNDRIELVRTHPYTTRQHLFRATSLERELVTGLRDFFEDAKHEERGIPLLSTIPEEELKAYARRHRIAWDYEEGFPDVRAFIENLHGKHPATKPALKKSFAWLSGK